MVAEKAENLKLKAKNHSSKFKTCLILSFTLWFCIFHFPPYVFAASGPVRYRVFPLKRISAEQGRKYLAEVGIGTVSKLPKTNTLLVTAGPRELIKANAILKLVDAKEPFRIKLICPASEAENLPSNDRIAAEVGDILIGTFFNPPGGKDRAKAIIDIYEDEVIAVAPADKIGKIIAAIEQLKGNDEQGTKPAPSTSSGLAPSESVLSLIEGVEGVEGARRHKGPANSEDRKSVV